jgi:predicted transcriptional regulator
MSDKQRVIDAIQSMSESATLSEISESVAILAAIRRGEAAADRGQVIAHEEVSRRSGSWTGK